MEHMVRYVPVMKYIPVGSLVALGLYIVYKFLYLLLNRGSSPRGLAPVVATIGGAFGLNAAIVMHYWYTPASFDLIEDVALLTLVGLLWLTIMHIADAQKSKAFYAQLMEAFRQLRETARAVEDVPHVPEMLAELRDLGSTATRLAQLEQVLSEKEAAFQKREKELLEREAKQVEKEQKFEKETGVRLPTSPSLSSPHFLEID